jgi:hypothetical protein
VTVRNGSGERVFQLGSPAEALLLEAADWHRIEHFASEAILLVLASEPYDPEDYIREPGR